MPTDFPANRFYFVYGFVTGEEAAFYMDSVKQKNRRGFTLAVLLVAITVGLIVIASLLSLVVMMNSYLVKRTATSKLSSELYHVKNEISDWFYRYDTERYMLYEHPDSALSFRNMDDPADLRTLQFNRNDKRFFDLINGVSDEGSEVSWRTYTLIRDVSFDYDGDISDIVKCTVVYTADGKTGEYVFALVKKSGQPSP